MAKQFFMGGAWARNEVMLRQRENRYEDYVGEEQQDQHSGNRSRKRIQKSVLGLDSRDFHYKGDAVNILHEEPQPGGDVRLYFERISHSQDASAGTYYIDARKTADGRLEFGGEATRTRSY